MKYTLTFLVLLTFIALSSAQVLIIPSDISIKEPQIGLFGQTALTPIASEFVGGKMFHERNTYFSEMISAKMNAWMKETYPNVIIYDPQDSIVNLNKLKGAILREMSVYESLKTRPLFGSGGFKPKEGANTKYLLNKLKEKYNVKYVVYVFANSLYREDGLFFSTEFPEYRGHSRFFGVLLDTETGYIEVIKNVKDKNRSRLVSIAPGFSNNKYVERTPIFKKVNEKYIAKRCKKIQKKLSRKIAKLN